ncbi:unnamed protein product [Auanema sp. JU1783]|nr:unnamed protein product [Auanema sp. JU1783]
MKSFLFVLLILSSLVSTKHHKPSKEDQLKGMKEYAKVCNHDLLKVAQHDYTTQIDSCAEFNCIYEILEKLNNTMPVEQRNKSCIVF